MSRDRKLLELSLEVPVSSVIRRATPGWASETPSGSSWSAEGRQECNASSTMRYRNIGRPMRENDVTEALARDRQRQQTALGSLKSHVAHPWQSGNAGCPFRSPPRSLRSRMRFSSNWSVNPSKHERTANLEEFSSSIVRFEPGYRFRRRRSHRGPFVAGCDRISAGFGYDPRAHAGGYHMSPSLGAAGLGAYRRRSPPSRSLARESGTSPASTARRQSNAPAHFVSCCRWRRRANLIVSISLLERTEMLEDIERYLERWPCDFYMRGPAAQLLIACNTLCQNIEID
jgi:hypothetical protein